MRGHKGVCRSFTLPRAARVACGALASSSACPSLHARDPTLTTTLRTPLPPQNTQTASPAVRWFWEVVEALEAEALAQLVQFVTGTSKVPLEGFRALQGIGGPQKFQIHKAYGAGGCPVELGGAVERVWGARRFQCV